MKFFRTIFMSVVEETGNAIHCRLGGIGLSPRGEM